MEWLDEALYVQQLTCPPALYGKTLKQLAWGSHFNVNVIQVIRKGKVRNMPSGTLELHEGDLLVKVEPGVLDACNQERHQEDYHDGYVIESHGDLENVFEDDTESKVEHQEDQYREQSFRIAFFHFRASFLCSRVA